MANEAFKNYSLDHLGIAVHDLEKSIEFYSQNFTFPITHRETLESQGVELVFLDVGNTRFELLGSARAGSKIEAYLAKHGEGLHHICYRVNDIKAELSRLKGLGFELIDQTPRPGAHGSMIAFVHPKSCQGVLTELCQY